MPDQTTEEMNRFAAELLGWKEAWRGLWFWPGTSAREQHEPIDLPDFIHDLGACPPLLKRLARRGNFYWDEIDERWSYALWTGVLFHSPESEPGRCIVEAAMYVFPEGKERDD